MGTRVIAATSVWGNTVTTTGAKWLLLLLLFSCDSDRPSTPPAPQPALPALPPPPSFNADSAYAFVKQQVDFGPRVPGSAAHVACADWMVAKFKSYGASVTEQKGTVTAFNGQQLPLRNIIASWAPAKKERILLLAHYDTRPFADRDDERKNEPILGANDGGSGVGILLEIARHLGASTDSALLGVDILLTDVEDYGEPSGPSRRTGTASTPGRSAASIG
ncbi:MAG: M28 family peptidase [Flavobacteriales bacterium]|nr:M28 family peptidase [Flavobacteriales bacterium]